MAKGNSVVIEVNPEGMSECFRSEQMRAVLEEAARQVAAEKTAGARAHLKGEMPTSGLYGYRMKLGRKTWIAVIHPNNRAAYAIGKKYGAKNL